MDKPISILLVDDQVKNLMVLEAILDSPEYQLVKATTTDEALLALMQDDYAAIVLDVQMPGLSGIELARLIKQRKKTQHIPIIFLTAYYQEDEHIMLGYGAGAVDYITKPLNPAVLRSKVGVFIDLFRKTAALAQMNRAMEAEIVERQKAEERFRLVVEAAPNAMVVFSESGRITLINSRTELLFGYARGELLGRSVSLLIREDFHAPDSETGLSPYSETQAAGRELVGQRKDGSEVPIEIGLSRFESWDGNFELASFVDITERKKSEAALRAANAELEAKNIELQRQADDRVKRIQAETAKAEAEAARERSALLADASRILAGSFDAEVTLAGLSKAAVTRLAACCLIDIAKEDGTIHLQEVAFYQDKRDARLREIFAKICAAPGRQLAVHEVLRTCETETWNSLDDAQLFELGCSEEDVATLRDMGLSCFVIAPLSARGRVLGTLSLSCMAGHSFSRSEVTLIEELAARAALAVDNARLYHDAAQAREAAEAADSAKDRFLAMLSHELRTPLSPVLHAVALLDEEEDCPESVREQLGMIRRNVQLEARLIDDLLDLTRIRNGKLQLQRESVDAHDLLRRALEICASEISARRLRITLELRAHSPQLFVDPARMQQIFWNLITNAVKYTQTGGSVRLATSNHPGTGMLCVEVSDSGIGIEPERVGGIFNAFEQAHGQRSSGLGLGLAICRALATLHSGTIEARSEGSGRGTTFTVILPVTSEEPSKPALPYISPSGNPNAIPLNLLLVEDHRDTADTLKKLLIRRGYHVRLARSLTEAMAAMEGCDVLLSDIGLPDGCGLDLMPKFVESAAGRAIAGIALSGFGMPEDIERSRAAGFSDHLTKPVDIALLHKTLLRIGGALGSSTVS
ncbi:MAG: sensor hybrid histidine kinase [Chthoniobacteraceae bacterium]|nr:sensor hybrid histidine kinase [Chthoniobacteraceae bacterium]